MLNKSYNIGMANSSTETDRPATSSGKHRTDGNNICKIKCKTTDIHVFVLGKMPNY